MKRRDSLQSAVSLAVLGAGWRVRFPHARIRLGYAAIDDIAAFGFPGNQLRPSVVGYLEALDRWNDAS